MLTAKKLIFAPVFLIVFAIFIYQLSFILKSYDFVVSLSINTLIQLIILSALIFLSSFTFVLFATFAFNWKLILPVGILTPLVPFAFWDMSLSAVFAVGISVSLLLTYLTLDNTLKSYLSFNPTALLGPSVRHLSGFLILSFCLVYFLSASKIIAQNGLQIPDSLIDTALKFSSPTSPNSPDLPQLSIPPDLLKQTVKDQLQGLIKPYQGFVPATLAVMLFLTLQSLTSILNLLIYPLLWIIFYILEKTGFIKFVVEQRPVKKMLV